ncbi:protein of unknown function [Pseudomonas mediterranea]
MPENLSASVRGEMARNALERASSGARFGAGCTLTVRCGAQIAKDGGARKLPTLTALLPVVRLYLQINIYLFRGLELFLGQPDSVFKGPLRQRRQAPGELAEIRDELCKSKSTAITIFKAASDWRSGYVLPSKARSNVMKKT